MAVLELRGSTVWAQPCQFHHVLTIYECMPFEENNILFDAFVFTTPVLQSIGKGSFEDESCLVASSWASGGPDSFRVPE